MSSSRNLSPVVHYTRPFPEPPYSGSNTRRMRCAPFGILLTDALHGTRYQLFCDEFPASLPSSHTPHCLPLPSVRSHSPKSYTTAFVTPPTFPILGDRQCEETKAIIASACASCFVLHSTHACPTFSTYSRSGKPCPQRLFFV